MCCFSLVVCFTATYAWFTSMRQQNLSNENFVVTNNEGFVKNIKVYNQSGDTPYIFKSTPAAIYDVDNEHVTLSESNEDIQIRSYQSLSENPDSTVLYLFELDDTKLPGRDFSIRAKTETTDSLSNGSNGTNGSLVFKGNDGYAAHPIVFDVEASVKAEMQALDPSLDDSYFGHNSMSSIISFSSKNYASALTLTNGVYDLSSDFENITAQSFVNANNGVGETTYSYTSHSIDTYTRAADSEEDIPNCVAVVCHYNAAALQYIFNLNLGNVATDFESIGFTCDWYFEIR